MRFSRAALAAGIVVAVLWAAYLVIWMLPFEPGDLGIVPRSLSGLKGIGLAWLAHVNIQHLAANSGPLFVLLLLALRTDTLRTILASVLILALGGTLVWLFGGNGRHIGASGLVYGLVGYLGLYGFFHRRAWSMIVSVIVLVAFSALMGALFRNQPDVSWTSHFFGLASGALAAWLLGRAHDSDAEDQA